jgi:hypothetical protein
MSTLIQENVAFGLVIGCSVFGMFWGLVNTILIKKVDMDDYRHLRREVEKGENAFVDGGNTANEEED